MKIALIILTSIAITIVVAIAVIGLRDENQDNDNMFPQELNGNKKSN